MKKRSTLTIFLSLLFSLILIGTGFSTFVFPTADKLGEHEDDADGFIDDIDNNYTLDANAYTVYFFSSPGWAYYIKNTTRKEGQSMSDYLSVDNYLNYVKNDLTDSKYKSQFGDSTINKTSLKKIGYFPDDDADDIGTYGYRIRYADTCISSATFEEIPKPTTTGRDSRQFKLLFIGWTASLQSAMNYGYDSQGEYNYVSAYDELSLLDTEDNDNIDEANKIIYLFPVFTAGKDYNTQTEAVVRIHDRDTIILRDDNGNPLSYEGKTTTLDSSTLGIYFSKELYFSQTDSRNSGYYTYKNLNVQENVQYYLDFDFSSGIKGAGGWSGVWYNFWDTKRTTFDGKWDGERPNSSGTELKPLFDTTGKNKKEDHNCAVDEPGIYNIYVYVHNDGQYNYTDDYTDSCEDFEKIQISNTALVWYEDPKDSTKQVMTWASGNGGKYKVYVKIEKIIEIGLAGGRTKSMEYEFSQQLNKSVNIIPEEDTSSGSTAVVTEGMSSRYYITNNVFMEGTAINESISSYNSETQGQYFYPSDLSMIVGNDNIPMPVSQADSEKLKTFNDNYQKVYLNTLYDFTNSSVNKYSLKKNSDVIQADDKGDISSSNLPYDYTKLDSSSNYYIRTENTGFYSVAARIDVETKRVSGSIKNSNNTLEEHRYCTVTFKSCEIALAYGQPIYSNIYLYKNGDKVQTSDGKFIDTSDSGNWYARCVNTVQYGQPLTYDTEFEVRFGTGTTTKKLSELLSSGTTSYHLTNHLTGREFRFDASNKSNPLRRSYAFYLMPGDWKEGEIPKNTTK